MLTDDLLCTCRTDELRRAHVTYQDSVSKERQGEADRRAQEDRRRRNEVSCLGAAAALAIHTCPSSHAPAGQGACQPVRTAVHLPHVLQ